MLAKKYRLKKNNAFRATYRVKNVVTDGYVQMLRGRKKENRDAPTKVGFVVTKKIHKRAVRRNRIKRLYREACRLILKDNLAGKSQEFMSLVFVIKQDALILSFKECYQSVLKLLNK